MKTFLKNNSNENISYYLFYLTSFFSLMTCFGISYHHHFLSLAFIFILIDFKFLFFLTENLIRKIKNFKELFLMFFILLFIIFHSYNPQLYGFKLIIALIFSIYMFLGFKTHGFKPLCLGFYCLIIYSILQFIEANFFKTAFLSMFRFSFELYNTPFYFGQLHNLFASYALPVFPFMKGIIRVSSFISEPGFYSSILITGLIIFHKKKFLNPFIIISLFLAFSKVLILFIVGLFFWPIIKRLSMFGIIFGMCISYLFLGNIWLYYIEHNQLSKIKKNWPDIVHVKKIQDNLSKKLLLKNKIENYQKYNNKELVLSNASIVRRFSPAKDFLALSWIHKIIGEGFGKDYKKNILNKNYKTKQGMFYKESGASSFGTFLKGYGFLGLVLISLLFNKALYQSTNPKKIKFMLYAFLLINFPYPFLQFQLPQYLLISYALYQKENNKNLEKTYP